MTSTQDQVREQVRARYAAAAAAVTSGSGCGSGTSAAAAVETCCAPATDSSSCCSAEALDQDAVRFGAGLYTAGEQDELPVEALAASLGCGNPLSVAELREGETVLDLGSGGGIDVVLSARRVGPSGFAYGVDMTDEMLDLARSNAAKAGTTNVEFRKGTIEQIPLPDAAVDVVVSNCVINLSVDKPAVLAEMFRVLRPGGRVGVSDVVAEDHISPAERAERGSYVGCIAGALSRREYLDGLAAVGFADATVTFTHEAAPGMHTAIVRATKPAHPSAAATTMQAVPSTLATTEATELPMIAKEPNMTGPGHRPTVLFVCVHNAGRSQMAAGFLTEMAGDQVDVRSAGSLPADQVNPVAVAAMAEVGIDIATQQPKMLTTDAVQAADVVITMGCGDTCPVFPGKRYEDWDLPDPAGQPIDAVRPIRDQIRDRVQHLVAELLPNKTPSADSARSG
jgi:arsenite methyltransferase